MAEVKKETANLLVAQMREAVTKEAKMVVRESDRNIFVTSLSNLHLVGVKKSI